MTMLDELQVAPAGFCLQRFELFNWGTFHQRIWQINPNGQTALLTGENGSGKSTLVDGLLTLLVPNHKRSYNQAAGAGGKRERDERSYVMGAYSKLQRGEEYGGQTQYLRTTADYAVLLACFTNQAKGRTVTLAQFFWHANGLQKFYVVAPSALSIAEAFSQIEDIKSLKRRLRLLDAQVYDQFNQYSKQFQRLFGLRSEKAMELFNQTVMIKEIRRLNDFVRDHMLEKPDSRAKIEVVIDSHEHLTRAHDALQRAEQQLDLLDPLMAEVRKYEKTGAELATAQRCEQILPAWFARRQRTLLEAEIAIFIEHQAVNERQRAACSALLASLRQKDTELAVAIANDDVGRQLQQIEMELSYAQADLQRRKEQAQQYNRTVQALGLAAYQDEDTFYATQQQAKALRPQAERRIQELERQIEQLSGQKHTQVEQLQTQQHELVSLRQRKSQIPSRSLELRQRLLDALGIPAADIPFAGELLRVREQEQAWEGALERLLRNLGLRLLVPEQHYAAVSRYVNRTDLGGRLVFDRVPVVVPLRRQAPDERTLVGSKLQIKPDSEFHDWLSHELAQHYDYVCCEELGDFDRAAKAITREGLTKSGGVRHEKDDRFRIGDRQNYVLGWDNVTKIRAIEQDVQRLEQAVAAIDHQLSQRRDEKNAAGKQSQCIDTLLGQFTAFAAIDWRGQQAAIAARQALRAQLESSSDRLRELREEQAAVQQRVQKEEQLLRGLDADSGRIHTVLDARQRDLVQCNSIMAGVDETAIQQHSAEFEARLSGALTLANVEEQRRQLLLHYRQQQNSLSARQIALSSLVVKTMQAYKIKFPAETTEFDAAIQSIPDFEREHRRIQQDDLPRYRVRFKSLLNEKMVESITLLKSDLEGYEEEVKRSIAVLNSALRTINYTPDTYIQLKTEPTLNPEIRAFRGDLRACLPDVGRSQQDVDLEASFQRIKPLITRFKEDTLWTDKVTDVRQWLDFAAIEHYRTDQSIKEYYADSTGKSGGQKAKLAYTILASAIAYQYGLKGDDASSQGFRFVVIDEAFSRSDQENSRYAMTLFQELELQLLVVTPMTGIHIVEPFIAACHFVSNNQEGNYSQVQTLTIEQMRAQRLTGAAAHAEHAGDNQAPGRTDDGTHHA